MMEFSKGIPPKSHLQFYELYLGGGFNFSELSPRNLGKMVRFDEHNFEMG